MLNKYETGIKDFYHYFPALAMIVTVSRGSEKDAMAAAWHSPVSYDPPIYGTAIAPKRYTYEMIEDSREFGINFMPFELAELVAQVGGCSGRDLDKFDRFRIEEVDPVATSAPILSASYAAYECRLHSSHTYGDHKWFAGEVLATHVNSAVFDENGVILPEKARPILYIGNDLYMKPASDDAVHLDRKKLIGSLG